MNCKSPQQAFEQPGRAGTSIAIVLTSSPPSSQTGLCKVLQAAGFSVTFIHEADGLLVHRDSHPSLVVIDLTAPVSNATKNLNRLAERAAVPQVVYWGTGPTDIGVVEFDQTVSLNWLAGAWHVDTVHQLEHRLRQDRRALLNITPDDVLAALQADQIELHYQPAVSLRPTKSGCPVEALLRWRHPRFDILTAGEFLPTGPDPLVRRQLTDFALRSAVQQLQVWRDAGIDTPIAVNLDASLLNDILFPKRLSLLIREFDVGADRLHLEISEQGVMNGTAETEAIIEALTDRDFRLSVDDFGGSTASMSKIFLLPFAELKISADLIRLIVRSDRARRLTRGIIQLAHELDMVACGKGVETSEQLLLLKGIGCDTAQGWYVGGPVPPNALNYLIAQTREEAGDDRKATSERSGEGR
jgi:EAL domain-containing protein (putative c-di-GMP-specific phosphodiesterase class I)